MEENAKIKAQTFENFSKYRSRDSEERFLVEKTKLVAASQLDPKSIADAYWLWIGIDIYRDGAKYLSKIFLSHGKYSGRGYTVSKKEEFYRVKSFFLNRKDPSVWRWEGHGLKDYHVPNFTMGGHMAMLAGLERYINTLKDLGANTSTLETQRENLREFIIKKLKIIKKANKHAARDPNYDINKRMDRFDKLGKIAEDMMSEFLIKAGKVDISEIIIQNTSFELPNMVDVFRKFLTEAREAENSYSDCILICLMRAYMSTGMSAENAKEAAHKNIEELFYDNTARKIDDK